MTTDQHEPYGMEPVVYFTVERWDTYIGGWTATSEWTTLAAARVDANLNRTAWPSTDGEPTHYRIVETRVHRLTVTPTRSHQTPKGS